MKINDTLRANYVNRWTIVNTSGNQSLAAHTFGVCAIASAICDELGIDDSMALKMGMEHDRNEIISGDMPTPFKKMMKVRGFNPDHEFPEFKYYMKVLGPYSKIVASADLLEAAWYISENAVGAHAKKVKDNIINRLHVIIEDDCPFDLSDAITKVANQVFSGDFINE